VWMSILHGTSKAREAFLGAGCSRFVIVLVWLLALPGCTSEQLGAFSEAMRDTNEGIRATSSTNYPTVSQPVFQPNPSPWCIQVTRFPAVGTIFQARLQNTCNETIHVTYGYRTRLDGTPPQVPWCTPGYAGLRSGTTTLSPWQSEPVAPLTCGHLDQVFWCACSDAHARAAFAEPAGLGVHNCRCGCVPR
jgi:hypothetical protein